MVEIIKRGELPEKQEFQTTCTNCKTEFKFTRGEASDGSGGDQRDAGLLKIPCPLCKKECFVDGYRRSR